MNIIMINGSPRKSGERIISGLVNSIDNFCVTKYNGKWVETEEKGCGIISK